MMKLIGFIRFGLILYFLFAFVDYFKEFTVDDSVAWLYAIMVGTLITFYYNLKQGQYEFSDQSFLENKFLRIVSIALMMILVLSYLKFTLEGSHNDFSVFLHKERFETWAVVVILGFLIVQDVKYLLTYSREGNSYD